MDDSNIGRQLGHCRIEKKLGSGGMGTVYLAHHDGLHRKVAIKVLPGDLAEEPGFIERFLREARLAARLEHPNVVQVYDVGEEQGTYYICMQYVEGKSLEAILRERKRISLQESLAIAKRVAVALGTAHKLGIVHRDIKPANILISREGVVKVVDFGLAKDRDAGRSISGSGQIMGTPHYMSPEQAQSGNVDRRSDIYSLGATLYHLITGRRPFDGESPLSIVLKHVREEPVSPRLIDPSIPEAVCALIARMMSKDPSARHGAAEELVRDLDALKPGLSMVSLPSGRPRRHAAIVALPLAGILIVGIVIGMVLAGRESPLPPPPPAAAPVPPAPPPEASRAPEPAPPERPPAPRPGPGRKGALLDRVRDQKERRLTEQLIARTEEFLRAIQQKDAKAARAMADRLTFGDLTEEEGREMFLRALGGRGELESWEFEDVQVRMGGRPFGPAPHGTCVMTYRLKYPMGDLKAVQQPIHWVYRTDGAWYVTRTPRDR